MASNLGPALALSKASFLPGHGNKSKPSLSLSHSIESTTAVWLDCRQKLPTGWANLAQTKIHHALLWPAVQHTKAAMGDLFDIFALDILV